MVLLLVLRGELLFLLLPQLLPVHMTGHRRRIIQGEADPPHLPESGQGWQECCQDRKDHHRQDAAGIFQSATHQEALQHGAFACPRPPKSEQSSLCDHLAESGKAPALRGFVGERRALATTSLYLVIFSNGENHPNLPSNLVSTLLSER